MIDIFQEIWSTVRRNKMRTFLTGFAVAWGIFLLIVLLAAGNGLQSGMTHNFRHMSSNMMNLYPDRTSMPYKGYQKNRKVKLRPGDAEYIKENHPEVNLYGGEIHQGKNVSYGKNSIHNLIKGVGVDYPRIESLEMLRGRFLNEIDMREKRKVIVVTPKLERVLFYGADAIGKQVNVDGILFTVIGAYDAPEWYDKPDLLIPYTTADALYNKDNIVHVIKITTQGLYTKEANEEFEQRLRQTVGQRAQFDKEDKTALWIWNTTTNALMMRGIFSGILFFMWVVGIGTLIAGVVGVSNIMLISVRERTKEFGIRKALGAKPWDIIKLVLIESVIITGVFGYIGMMAGIGVAELANAVVDQAIQGGANIPFRSPEVPLGIVIAANVILIIAGILAGYFPARKAVSVTAVESMRAE